MLINHNQNANIACAIMAGGENKRMGQHKAFLDYQGKKFIELIRENMQNWFDEVFIVTDRKDLFLDNFGPVYEDIIPDMGPLGALYTALSVAGAEYVFCIACDMPNPCDSIISRLIQASKDRKFDCLVPNGERGPEPLFAIYRKSMINVIEEEITSIRLKVSGIYKKCNTNFIDMNMDEAGFININTPSEYIRYTRTIKNTDEG